jgi:hypothetical protein
MFKFLSLYVSVPKSTPYFFPSSDKSTFVLLAPALMSDIIFNFLVKGILRLITALMVLLSTFTPPRSEDPVLAYTFGLI